MAINPYFKNYSGEQDITEDLTVEIIKTMGKDMLYIPKNKFLEDEIFGEQKGISFKDGIPLEMYINSTTGFGGQGDIASKFGIEIRDTVLLTVSRKRFMQEVQSRFPEITRPREGDIIFFPLARALFEINFVEHENPFYQLGKLYSYNLTCELYLYNNDQFNTGNTDVDNVEAEHKQDSSIMQENNTIQQLGSEVLDFTEIDPFSEGKY